MQALEHWGQIGAAILGVAYVVASAGARLLPASWRLTHWFCRIAYDSRALRKIIK